MFTGIVISGSQLAYAASVTVQHDNLNVRTGPGTNYEQIQKVHTNETFSIIQEQEEWVEIELSNGTGWVSKEYVTISEEDTEEADATEDVEAETVQTNPSTETNTIKIYYDHSQIRKGPGTTYPITDFADKGTSFEVISADDEWYEIKNNQIQGFIHKGLVDVPQSKRSSGIKHKTIVIDAGHGGRDVGSISASGEYEKDFTYRTAQLLSHELKALGANPIFTRNEDEFISLASRATLSNFLDTDAFISIHYNSVPELPNVEGMETFYYHDQSKELATLIQKEMMKETESRDRGITYGDYQVLRQNLKPAVLLELGFLSNPEMEQLLLTDAYQKKMVTGMINGLLYYFNQ